MSRSYKKLWKLMIDKEINKTELTKKREYPPTRWRILGETNPCRLKRLKKSAQC